VRIKLPRSALRKIARSAGRHHVMPLRIVVSYSAMPLSVAGVIDIAPRIDR
jgi:hypothetical protein